MDDVINKWLEHKRANQNCAVSTLEKYRTYLVRLVEFLSDTGLLEATHEQLHDFTGMHLYKQKVSPSSRKVYVAAVKGFYSFCTEENIIDVDPSVRLMYPKVSRKLPKAMGLSNAEKLLMQPDLSEFIGLRDAAMLAVLMSTGLRASGLTSLNESSVIKFKNNGIDRLALRLIEKGGHERIVPLSVEAMILLQAYLGHKDLSEIDRLLVNGDQVLFVSTMNRNVPAWEYRGEHRRLSRIAVHALIQRHAEKAGIPMDEAHPHALRHLLGAELAEDDVTPLQMQTIFGHADVNTSAIYHQLAIRKLTEIIDTANPLSKMNTPVSALIKDLRESGHL